MLSVCWCDSVGHALWGGVSEVIWGDSGPKSFVQEVYAQKNKANVRYGMIPL